MERMKDDKTQPQPWHEADEKPKAPRRGGAPLGTHSLTDRGPEVGMPKRDPDAERSKPQRPAADEPAAPDPLAEPRANTPRR